MKRYKTREQVIQVLKDATERMQREQDNARATLNAQGVHAGYKELKYRTVAGPFKVREGIFESRRFYFNPLTLEATSYDWWHMLTVRNGKLIWNICGYSQQTAKHQKALARALTVLGIEPDLKVCTRANIGNLQSWQDTLIREWSDAKIRAKYCREASRKGYVGYVKRLEREMTRLKAAKIGLWFTEQAKTVALAHAEQERKNKNSWLREKRERRLAQAKEREPCAVNAYSPPRDNVANVAHTARPRLSVVRGEQ